MKWAYLLPLLLALLLSPSPIFSDELDPGEMSNAEIIAELMRNLDVREQSLNKRELALNERDLILDQRERQLTSRESNLNLIEKSLDVTESYWRSFKGDLKTEFWRGILWGSLGGFLAGNVTGITLGIKLRL